MMYGSGPGDDDDDEYSGMSTSTEVEYGTGLRSVSGYGVSININQKEVEWEEAKQRLDRQGKLDGVDDEGRRELIRDELARGNYGVSHTTSDKTTQGPATGTRLGNMLRSSFAALTTKE